MQDQIILSKKVEYQDAESRQFLSSTVAKLQNLVQQSLIQFKLDIAEFYASQLLALAPKLSSGQIAMAIVHLNKCRYAEAIGMAEKALSLGATNPEAFVTASIAYRENNRLDDALDTIKKALLLYPNGPRIQHEHSVCENLKNPKPVAIKTAIATTLIDVEHTIESFIEYHVSIGIDHLFLFFDNPNDAAIAKAARYSQVSIIKHDAHLKSAWKKLSGYQYYGSDINSRHVARQLLNVEVANNLCLKRGINWLLHLDSDEAFYCPNENVNDHFVSLYNRDIRNARYLNYEALPTSLSVKDYFKEVTLFKTNVATIVDMTTEQKQYYRSVSKKSQQRFHFYANGKSAAQVSPSLTPWGVHSFSKPDPLRFEFTETNKPAYILHYPCCGFEHFWNKYQTLGDFPNNFFGGADINTSIGSFHTDSRDAVATGNIELAKDFYQQRALLNNKPLIQDLVDIGVLSSITDVQQALG